MSKVYEAAPNIVKVTMTDKTGTAERHIVGYSLDEVIEAVTLSLDGAEQKPLTKTHKTRKPRSTKAEMASGAKLRPSAGLCSDTPPVSEATAEKGRRESSSATVGSSKRRPMSRFTLEKVLRGFTAAARAAAAPTSGAEPGRKETTEGVVRPPSGPGRQTGARPRTQATAELVVPRSMPSVSGTPGSGAAEAEAEEAARRSRVRSAQEWPGRTDKDTRVGSGRWTLGSIEDGATRSTRLQFEGTRAARRARH